VIPRAFPPVIRTSALAHVMHDYANDWHARVIIPSVVCGCSNPATILGTVWTERVSFTKRPDKATEVLPYYW